MNTAKNSLFWFLSFVFEPPFWLSSLGVLALLLVVLTVKGAIKFFDWYQTYKVKRIIKANYENRTFIKHKLGSVDYILNYKYLEAVLEIEILQVNEIHISKKEKFEKPEEIAVYLRLYLLPNMESYQQSKIVAKDLSPHFGENFTFRCFIDDLDYRKILIRLYRHHKFLRDMPIGDALIELSKTNLRLGFGQVQMYNYNPNLHDPLGQICFSIRYKPFHTKLIINIIECRNLKSMDFNGLSDPYVKITATIRERIVFKAKTKVKKETLCPFFHETFTIKVTATDLQQIDLKMLVKDHDLFGANDVIGSVRLGIRPDSETAEKQWNAMLENLQCPQTAWHYLQPDD